MTGFWCNSETGGVILGWLGAVESVVSIILSYFMYKDTFNHFGDQFIVTASAVFAFSVSNLLSSILLFVGTATRNSVFLIPWLITKTVAIVALGVTFAAQFILPLSFIIGSVFAIAINIFLWTSVLALYQHMRLEEVTEQVMTRLSA